MKRFLLRIFKIYRADQNASVAVEAVFVFPVLLILFLGTLDLGYGIMSNQKIIKSSQIVADLITRMMTVEQLDIDEAVEAGRLALQPYETDELGFDIISFKFIEDDKAEIVWRHTTPNMTPVTNPEANVAPIAEEGGGVVMVVAKYKYQPIIGGNVVGEIPMQETAFARGRRSEIVCKVGVPGC